MSSLVAGKNALQMFWSFLCVTSIVIVYVALAMSLVCKVRLRVGVASLGIQLVYLCRQLISAKK